MDNIEIITTRVQTAIAIREKVKVKEIPQVMDRLFEELFPLLKNEVQCVGPPFVLYHSWSQDEVDLDVGFPVAGEGVTVGKVRPIQLPAVKAAVAMHIGPYDKLVDTYNGMMVWMKQKGQVPADYMWEEYLNSPDDTPPEKLMTKLYWPLK
jgi:effector-binding domain-containing protein